MKKVFLSLAVTAFCVLTTSVTMAAPSKAPAVTPAILEAGKKSYTMNCVVCHGDKGDGKGPAGAAMKPAPRNFAVDKFKNGDSVDAVFKTTTEGLKGTSMAGFAHIPESDRWALAYYVLSFKPKK